MPLWLLGALGWLRKAAAAVFGVALRYPWQTACIALLLASVWLWHGWDGADAKLKSCETGRVADRKAYTDAQAAALAKAQAAKAKVEQDYRNLAETTDANEQKARTDAMADADEYIRTHRLPARPAASPAGGPAAAAQDHGAQGSDGSGAAAVVDEIGVSADDIRICTGNTTRLQAVRSWALSLTSPPAPR